MRLARLSGPMVLTGIGLMAMAGLELATGQPELALRLAASFGVVSVLLIVGGLLFSDMDRLHRKDERERPKDKDTKKPPA